MKTKNQISSLGIQTLYAGVEVFFLSRQEFVFHITLCEKKKGQLEIAWQEQNLDLEAAKKVLKKVSYFYLLITGKPVIHKKLSKFYENPQELTGTLLPDAKQGEFVAQCSEASGLFYGAVVRREVLQEVLGLFSAARLYPQTVLLGPSVLTALPSFFNHNGTIATASCTVTVEDQSVSFSNTLQQEPGTIQLGNDQVHSLNLPSLCLCIQAQAHYPLVSTIDDAEVKKVIGESVQKTRFKKLLVSAVVVLMVLTGGNFFFNRSYAETYQQLDEQLALNRQMLNEIDKLEKDIGEKRSLLGKRPGSNGPVISFIGDRLAATVPSRIRLLNLEIFPVEGKISKEKPIGFSFGKVLVEGITSESDVLDQWIGECKHFDWVKDVLIVKYNFDNEKKRGWFKLELLLK